MRFEIKREVAPAQQLDGQDEVAEQTVASAALIEEPASLAGRSESQSEIETLQKELLELVQELLFEQLYADLTQCKEAIQDRKKKVVRIRENSSQLTPEKMQEAIPAFEQFQIDANIFAPYLAHGEVVMKTALRSSDMHDRTLAHLEEIIEEYAEDTNQADISKVIQIGEDRMADPVVYFHNEVELVTGSLVDQNTFSDAAEQLKETLKKLAATPTVEAAKEVEMAQVKLQEIVRVPDESDVVAQQERAAAQQDQPAPEEVGANSGGGDFRA